MNKRDKNLLQDMLNNAYLAREFARNRKRDDLDNDVMYAYAVVRAIEIIGEAANHVSDETKSTYPETEWQNIAGMRHWLAHGYNRVDNDIVWDVLNENLPALITQLSTILNDDANTNS